MPCNANPGNPHTWQVVGDFLLCTRCARAILIADLEDWRRDSIIGAVVRRQGQAAARKLADAINRGREATA